jgi:3-methyladenine DNA glycosylase AlkD
VATQEKAKASAWFFKTGPGEYGEGDRFLGVTVPEQRRVARRFDLLPLHEAVRLLHSPWHEERLTALFILVRRYERGSPGEQQEVFDAYLGNLDRVNNWDLVDSSALQIVGRHLATRKRTLLRHLSRSPDLWRRRVAIIATLAFIRERDFGDTITIAGILLADPHDLIHKAVGWMLREVGNRDRAVLETFLDRHARRMPRTMLRYAIEKLPKGMRSRYLGSRVAGRGSRVAGRGSRVAGRGSRVAGRGSRVAGRGSVN